MKTILHEILNNEYGTEQCSSQVSSHRRSSCSCDVCRGRTYEKGGGVYKPEANGTPMQQELGNPDREPSGADGNATILFNAVPAKRPDGISRIYYSINGSRGSNYSGCNIKVKIKNNNSNFRPPVPIMSEDDYINCFFMVSLTRMIGDSRSRKFVDLEGKSEALRKGIPWKRINLSNSITAQQEKEYSIEIPLQVLKAAYVMNENDQSAMVELWFYWQQPVFQNWKRTQFRNYKKYSNLKFFLVKPVEIVVQEGVTPERNLQKEEEFKLKHRKLLSSVSTAVGGSITVTDMVAKSITQTDNVTITASTSTKTTQTVAAEVKPTIIEIPFLDILKISGSWSKETTDMASHSYSDTKALTEGLTKITSNTVNYTPATRKGKFRKVYLEPILKSIAVKFIDYRDIDQNGLVRSRKSDNKIYVVYLIEGWRINTEIFTNK